MSRMTDEPVMQFKARVSACVKHQDDSWDSQCLHCKVAELQEELVATKCDWVKRERYHKAKLARVEKDVTDIADRLSDLCWDMHEYGGQHWSGDFSKLIDELKQALADVPNEPEGDLN